MDTKIIRTFLEVAETGNFSAAAEHLNVAQTTVSARIKGLEDQVGTAVFERRKSGASLTPAGEKLYRMAPEFVLLGERLLQELREPEANQATLRVGLESSVSDDHILPWIKWIQDEFENVSVSVLVGKYKEIFGAFSEKHLDVGLVYDPPEEAGFKVDLLKEEKLGLVSTDPKIRSVSSPQFIYLDWGARFTKKFEAHFPHHRNSALYFSEPALARRYILQHGGAAYARMGLSKPFFESQEIVWIDEAPIFPHPLYVVCPRGRKSIVADRAVQGLSKFFP